MITPFWLVYSFPHSMKENPGIWHNVTTACAAQFKIHISKAQNALCLRSILTNETKKGALKIFIVFFLSEVHLFFIFAAGTINK